jgi:hypothetical protein
VILGFWASVLMVLVAQKVHVVSPRSIRGRLRAVVDGNVEEGE